VSPPNIASTEAADDTLALLDVRRWFLTRAQRGNPAGRLYRDAPDDVAWTAGNDVRPLIDGATYFARLCAELRDAGPGDQVYFVDWRGDPDERLDGPGSAVMVEFARAASAGAVVSGLVWRSHLDRFRFSEVENRNLVEALYSIGAKVLLDQRVRRGGSHHQKFVVIRHATDPARDVAFVGGTDLGHGRRDDHEHGGDPQTQPMSHWYGPRPPWHDAMVEIRGPAVVDVECCFRERWEDPTSPDHLRPWLWAADRLRGEPTDASRLPSPLPPPPPAGDDVVQLLRTYPSLSPKYPFAPLGERTVARGYAKALLGARELVYVEDQFLWSTTVASVFAEALRRVPTLRMVAVVPRYPDADGTLQLPSKDATHADALHCLRAAGGDRVQIFDVENREGTPIYVHAKICIIDDTWTSVGSANLNRRSWTHDSELAAAVVSPDAGRTPAPTASFAGRLRLALWSEHMGGDAGERLAGLSLHVAADLMAQRAAELERWHRSGRRGPRPPGHLRPHRCPVVAPAMRAVIEPFTRTVVDPDGRPFGWRRAGRW
jgi:phosphatidylserine/phosphatidylglycerophosphate/cardiolipin synthase-like enzyme